MFLGSSSGLDNMHEFRKARETLMNDVETPKESQKDRWNPYSFEGGTTAAIAGDNFVVVASDTRMSLQRHFIFDRNAEKIHELNDSAVLIAGAFKGDVLQLLRVLKARMHKFKFDHRSDMTVDLLSQALARNLYYRRFFPYLTGAALAGIDENGKGALFGYDPIGCIERCPYGAEGEGTAMITPFFDSQIGWDTQDKQVAEKPHLTLERAHSLIKDAFRMTTEREITTGDKIQIVTIVAGQKPKWETLQLRED